MSPILYLDVDYQPPTLEVIELCDYEFKIGPTQRDGLADAELMLTPNEYTQAKEKRVVWRGIVSQPALFGRQYLAKILREGFGV